MLYRALVFLIAFSTTSLADDRHIVDTIDGAKATGYLGHTKNLNGLPYSAIDFPMDVLPDEYDARTEVEMPPIRDQGACGSCWAHAPVRALEIAISKAKKEVVDLSEQEMLSCEKTAYKCSGGFMESANFLLTGITDETSWPYVGANLRCRLKPKKQYASTVKLLGDRNKSPTVEEIKAAIYYHGSSFVTVAAGNGWTGNGPELPRSACRVRGTNHMVTLVGWTKDNKWIMANSWGKNWGDKGYSLVPFDCAQIGDEAGYVEAKIVR